VLIQIRKKEIVYFSIQPNWGREEAISPLRKTQPCWAFPWGWKQVAAVTFILLGKGQLPKSWENSHWTSPWLHFSWLGHPTPAAAPSAPHPLLWPHSSEKAAHPNDLQSTHTKPTLKAALPLSLVLLTQLVQTLNRRAGEEGDKRWPRSRRGAI